MKYTGALRLLTCAVILPYLCSCALGRESAGEDEAPVDVSLPYREQIEDLKASDKVQSALAHVVSMKAGLRRDLIELTEIPAPPFGERDRARRVAELLLEAGLSDVTVDSVGNVIGRRAGRTGDRVIAYCAHIDTVFPPGTDVSVTVDGDRMLAPGIGDNARGVVVTLAVLRALEHADIETDADILFVGTVGEEGLGDLRGIKHLFAGDIPQIDAVIAVDGGDTNRIVYGGVGSHRYKVTFKGPGGHSWGAFGIVNPHHALGRAVAEFTKEGMPIAAHGPKTSYSVGRIGGGTSVNSIPFESWMEVDMRSGEQTALDEIDRAFQAAVQKALDAENSVRLSGEELTVDIERVGNRPAGRGDPESPLIQHAMAAMKAFGFEPDLAIASTDANYPISIGVPAITMSRGGISEDGHSLTESWQDKDSHLAIQIGLLTLLSEARFVP